MSGMKANVELPTSNFELRIAEWRIATISMFDVGRSMFDVRILEIAHG